MEQRPEQPPEGKLIADAANRLDLSIRKAAGRADISYGRWRQIVTGYQNVSPGVFAPVHAPAKTLARMAAVVGVTPDQMETQGKRPDAAEFMRQDAAAVASLAVVAEPRPAPADLPRRDVDFAAGIPPEEMAPHVAAIEQAAYRALVDLAGAELPGPDDPDVRETMLSLPGKAVFPENEHDQRTWDNPVYSPDERVIFMARLRVLRARAVKEQRQRRAGTGLTGHIPASGAVPALISVGGKAYRASS